MVEAANASSSVVVGLELGLGEAVLKELGDFLPGDQKFGFLVSIISSQPEVRLRAWGFVRGVLSDWDSDITSGSGFGMLFEDSM